MATIEINKNNKTKPVLEEMLSVSELLPASCKIFNLSRARTRQMSYSSLF